MDQRVVLDGVGIDRRTETEIVAHVRESLDRGSGGRIVTPTVDLLRLARRDPALRSQLAEADLVVAGSAPLLWASRLARAPLPERVAGLSLVRSLTAALATDGRSLYLFGGAPAFFGRIEAAHRAARALVRAYPGLRIAGHASPRPGFDRDPAARDALCREIVDAGPDVVCIGLSASAYPWLAEKLRRDLPGAWLVGCGAVIDALAADHARVPERTGRPSREWAHRLVREPGPLAERYLRQEGPYALGLLLRAAVRRR